jgi:cyclopropane fatty-acyl-phospholipid synthase-like methyltransferase
VEVTFIRFGTSSPGVFGFWVSLISAICMVVTATAHGTERDVMSQQKSTPVPAPDEVGRLYDRLALSAAATFGNNLHFGYWDDPDGDVPFSEAADRLTDIITEKLKIKPGSHVLDVGCGVGGPGVRLARNTGARVTGISVSREQVTLANSLAESAGLAERVVFQQADAMKMPFPAQSFDAVMALESIPHMPDRGQVLTQICRSLRPGGRLALTDIYERAPIPASKRPAVDRIINNDFKATLVQAEDYPPLLRNAGLWFEEILDISEQSCSKSLLWMLERINVAGPDFEAMFGDGMPGRADIADVIDIPELGYLVLAAKRPER